MWLEEWSPAISINSRQSSHSTALFHDVGPERQSVALVVRVKQWAGCEPFDSYQSGPEEVPIVSEQLVLVYLPRQLSVILASDCVIDLLLSVENV